MISKKQGWPKILNQWQSDSQDIKFEWGKHDCCLATCSGIEKITGVDPAKEFRGTYATEDGAREIIKANGGSVDSLSSGVFKAFGMFEIMPLVAGRGDPVLFEFDGRQTLGLCYGIKSLVVSEKGGLLIDTDKGIKAWRLP